MKKILRSKFMLRRKCGEKGEIKIYKGRLKVCRIRKTVFTTRVLHSSQIALSHNHVHIN